MLSTAVELPDDSDRAGFVKRTLSFEKGDWHQSAGHMPRMPFHGGDESSNARGWPLSLATFTITNVEDGKGGQTTASLNVRGALFLSVCRKSRDSDIWPRVPMGPVTSPEFRISPGKTKLRIILEGVYKERSTGRGGVVYGRGRPSPC
jgi:hypothetical protein